MPQITLIAWFCQFCFLQKHQVFKKKTVETLYLKAPALTGLGKIPDPWLSEEKKTIIKNWTLQYCILNKIRYFQISVKCP